MKEIRSSACPLDCPDACSLEVELQDGRVSALRGSRKNPDTDGFICTKVSRFARRLYGPDRLLHPMQRSGPKGSGLFERISWEEAARLIASRLRLTVGKYGGEAILPYCYGGSNGLMTQGLVDAHFFRRLGASRIQRTLCAASTTAAADAMYGRMPGTAFADYAQARLILLWGANPQHSNIHLLPHLKAARKRGARVILVDPRRILGAETVDTWLQPYPGTDVVLALAMIRHLHQRGMVDRAFLQQHSRGWEQLLDRASKYDLELASEITGIEARAMAEAAENYAAAEPAVLRCGWGLERNRNGLAGVAAVLALPAVAGKFGARGGGYTLSNSGAYRVDGELLAGHPEPATRQFNMSQLGQWLTAPLSPPIDVLFVYNANPVATVPNQNRVIAGLRREDLFTVVIEQVLTDTSAYADILLPATTFLEHTELSKGYGSYAIQLNGPAVAAAGEARSNAEIFRSLAQAMGWNDGLFAETEEDWVRRATASLQLRSRNKPEADSLKSTGIFIPDFPGPAPIQFQTVFPETADRRIDLYPAALGAEPFAFLENPSGSNYPLILISPASNRTVNSTLGEFNLPEVKLAMNPADAQARGLAEGQAVRIYNDLGEMHLPVRLDPGIRPGVISVPKGFWRRATGNHAGSTAVVPDNVTAISGGACFNDARVQVCALHTGFTP